MATAITSKTMELEGNLKAFQLPDILRFLVMGRMTGTLTFVNNEKNVDLLIKEGMLIGAGSAERFLKLGQILVYSGRITRKALDEALEDQRDSVRSMMLGEVLIERNFASREEIEQTLKLQIKEELWDLFNWTDGKFKFEHGMTLAMERPVITLEIEPLIEEGLHQIEKWRQIAGNLTNANEIFMVRPDLAAPPETKLGPSTWRVLSLINGRHSVQGLIYLSGLGKFETLCALDALLSMQLIEPLQRKTKRVQGDIQILTVPSKQGGAPTEEKEEAPEQEPEQEGESGLRGLLHLRRRGSRAPARENETRESTPPPVTSASQVGPYLTSVGLGCALINRLVSRLCMESPFKAEGTPAAIMESIWNDVSIRFPHADLLQLKGSALDATRYERYVQLAGGIDGALAGCHEDGMEALALFGRTLLERAAGRMGNAAQRLAAETARPYLDNLEVRHPAEFNPRAWASQWLS